MPVAIATNELTKYYSRGSVRALESCTLLVEKGIIFSLLGPNGAGKTTLIKLLLGIVRPTRGSAHILGSKISNYQIHRRIGYLAENHRFPEFLTARQVLYFYGQMGGTKPDILRERIPRLLEQVRLSDWSNTRIHKFSKGMLQRLGLGQALVTDPDLLFLDEPTDGIDPVGRKEIRDLLVELRNEGKTIFLNSHLLSEVERVSDQVAILKNGKLIRQGSVEEFISINGQHFIQVDGEMDTLKSVCGNLNIVLSDKNGIPVVTVENTQQLNRLIDDLRRRQVLIQSVTPRRISLEDFFIDVIEEDRA